MNILVTGGAGYIGSALISSLKGHTVVVVDNLSHGRRELVKTQFYHLDLVSSELEKVFQKHAFDVVFHLAAYKSVGESEQNPKKYADNVLGTKNLLALMKKYRVPHIVFSSSAAVYGNPRYVPVDEQHPLAPLSVYGQTKLDCEKLIEASGLLYHNLRYFNVVGDMLGYIDPQPENVIPIILEVATGKRKSFTIFGSDYATNDGTCIRDYVDIHDLVAAHVACLHAKTSAAINLGTAHGVSVKELLSIIQSITGNLPVVYGSRRLGDPQAVFASNAYAKKMLGWTPKVSIQQSVIAMCQAYKLI